MVEKDGRSAGLRHGDLLANSVCRKILVTLYPAEILAVSHRIGSIEAGEEASNFAADGNILDIRSHVKRMWIGGKEVSLESRHTRPYEKYKARPQAR